MWMVLPALSLAFVHIAGDNAGVVPDAAGSGIYVTVFVAYMVLGAAMSGTAAWIGVRTGTELGVLVRKLFGSGGKRLFAVVTLAISLPASALTGGYFAGWLLHLLTGLPPGAGALLCLAFFTLLAAGYWQELLHLSNYCSLLLAPAIIAMVALFWETPAPAAPAGIDWILVMALFGYNACGMRPSLATETAACLAHKGRKVIILVVAAKICEGVVTMAMAHIAAGAGAAGPLALAGAARAAFGPAGGWLFAFVLLCTFANTMVPAMVVNARHLACCAGISYWPALALAGLAVYGTSFLPYEAILAAMAAAGPVSAAFLGYTAWVLHKSGPNQQ